MIAAAVFIGILLSSILVVVLIPRFQLPPAGDGDPERLRLRNELRRTLIQIVGVVVLIIGAFGAYRQFNLDRDVRSSDRFFRASTQLDSRSSAQRVAATFSLERIAREAPQDFHEGVTMVLMAHLRERAGAISSDLHARSDPGPMAKLDADQQASLNVLGRLSTQFHKY